MKIATRPLGGKLVTLAPAGTTNVELLVRWTLDPMAQGPHKRVPDMTADELRILFLDNPDRQNFSIRRSADEHPLGRFYWRVWRFTALLTEIDWELNIFSADPLERGRGAGAFLPSRSWPISQSSEHSSKPDFGKRVRVPMRTIACTGRSFPSSPVFCSSSRGVLKLTATRQAATQQQLPLWERLARKRALVDWLNGLATVLSLVWGLPGRAWSVAADERRAPLSSRAHGIRTTRG